jgi:hypothetical protein
MKVNFFSVKVFSAWFKLISSVDSLMHKIATLCVHTNDYALLMIALFFI